MKRYFHDINIAFESLLANKLKSFLTALGIIFGVAAVISMLAIGKGAKQEILEQIKLVGVNNIVISPIVETSDEQKENNNANGQQQKKKYSPGLTMADLQSIKSVIPTVHKISPEIAMTSFVVQNGKRESAKILGVTKEYFDIYNLNLEQGFVFNDFQEENGIPVCIIGSNLRAKFFNKENPIGKYIKFGNIWLKVIGVIEKSVVPLTGFENTGINVFNDNIYIPAKTMLMRIRNRALITSKTLIRGNNDNNNQMSTNPAQNNNNNYHQLDRIIVQVNTSENLTSTAEVLSRMILRRHEDVKDYEITIPELLLKQEQRTNDIFNIVLGAIASISLLVGGIGIMNIMFATVMERIKEIGTRMAIGAKKKDIVVQFLAEAILISVTGGLIGVVLGVILSQLIHHFADIQTMISPGAVLIAFFVSASVGVIFGYTPAKRASEKDPIESLRYE